MTKKKISLNFQNYTDFKYDEKIIRKITEILLNNREVKTSSCLENKNYSELAIDFVFCDDKFIHKINKKYQNDIHNYLEEEFCKNNDQILIHWKIYGSNEKTYYEDKPVIERFTKSINWGNWQIKSIIN